MAQTTDNVNLKGGLLINMAFALRHLVVEPYFSALVLDSHSAIPDFTGELWNYGQANTPDLSGGVGTPEWPNVGGEDCPATSGKECRMMGAVIESRPARIGRQQL